jgi:hypothetical protein
MSETHTVNSAKQAATWQHAAAMPRAFGRNDQLQYGAVLLLAGVTLGLSRYLRPATRGFGTHEQLGLPACTFLQLTGIPCPSCGLTTSFAHAAHLHWLDSFIAQPFGFLAFWLTALSIPLTIYLLYHRIAWEQVMRARGVNPFLRVLLVLYLLSWIYKIYVMT